MNHVVEVRRLPDGRPRLMINGFGVATWPPPPDAFSDAYALEVARSVRVALVSSPKAGREDWPLVVEAAVPDDGSLPIRCSTPGCDRPIPKGGDGHPEICPTCLACLEMHARRPEPDRPRDGPCPLCKATVRGGMFSGAFLPARGPLAGHVPDCPNAVRGLPAAWGAGSLALALPIRLHCPECHALHVDEGEWATRVHHTHSCQWCGHTWRPAVGPTVGVRFLPGFKNERPPSPEPATPRGARSVLDMVSSLARDFKTVKQAEETVVRRAEDRNLDAVEARFGIFNATTRLWATIAPMPEAMARATAESWTLSSRSPEAPSYAPSVFEAALLWWLPGPPPEGDIPRDAPAAAPPEAP